MSQTVQWGTAYRVPLTLPSDTEESVVGTQWHQQAFFQVADMLGYLAAQRGAPWSVYTQLGLIGLEHTDGSPYTPMPDVVVLAQPPSAENLAAVRLERVGAPLFIAEMVSNSTAAHDLGEKRAVYAAAGVAEYMVFDPGGTLLRPVVQAWRREGSGLVPWRAGRDGWWTSRALEVGLRAAGALLRVRDRDGQEVLPVSVVRARLAQEAQARAAAERRAADLEEQLRRYGEDRGWRATE